MDCCYITSSTSLYTSFSNIDKDAQRQCDAIPSSIQSSQTSNNPDDILEKFGHVIQFYFYFK